MSETAQANGRNMYYTGMHGPEDQDDAIARLALVRERDQLQARIADLESGYAEYQAAYAEEWQDTLAELAAQNEALRTEIERCAEKFESYASLHAAKPDQVKAEANQRMADGARAALALPDLSAEILRKRDVHTIAKFLEESGKWVTNDAMLMARDAKTLREAADKCLSIANEQASQQAVINSAFDCEYELRRMADELEKVK